MVSGRALKETPVQEIGAQISNLEDLYLEFKTAVVPIDGRLRS